MYEAGDREPNFETLEAIADTFNVNMDTLLGKTREAPILFAENQDPDLVNGDPELTAYLDSLRNRPEMRMLFSVAKDATKADVEKEVAIIEALRKTEE